MQKNQVKPKRDKKKNIETGIIMGQNTNIFSQLSATFLQNKANTTEEEEVFLKNTQIVQYHDQNINRLISLLRKKAEVTKIKAVTELHEQINKMSAEDMEEFIPTFAQLYMQVILNEPSKQIIDVFIEIATDILNAHKKIAIKEINTLFGPLLISIRLSKLVALLFTGTEQELYTKALVLLLKKDVRKKFIVMFKIIMECDIREKIGQANYQRNCSAVMKLIKDFIRIYEKSVKAKQLESEFSLFICQISESFSSECVEDYIKNGGKAKAAILQVYSTLVWLASVHNEWKIEWERYSKIVGMNFLDKDPLVQQTLWKHCHKQWIEAILRLDSIHKEGKEDDNNNLLNIYLPKSDEKLLSALKLGGFQMYKQLPKLCEIFPWTSPSGNDPHKLLVNKLNFIRKFLTSLLQQEDENEARMECYFHLSVLFVTRIRTLDLSKAEQKRAKQINTLCSKLERQVIQNLQERYYSDPPTSKNVFTYYIPSFLGQLINKLHPNFEFKFNPQHTFSLFESIEPSVENNNIIQKIFENSKNNLALTLKFLEIFPKRPINLDMTSANKQIEVTAKIFLLTSEPKVGTAWFEQDWDLFKKIIAYDPRVTQRDLELEEDEDEQINKIYFKPSSRNFPSKLYDKPELDEVRFAYFQEKLLDAQAVSFIKYLIPLVNDVLIPRNPQFANRLLTIFKGRVDLIQQGKWQIGNHEVIIIRILSQLIVDLITKQKAVESVDSELIGVFLSNYCEFIRLMFNYKMEVEVEELLRKINQLLPFERYREPLFQSCKKSVTLAYQTLLRGSLEGQQDKIRKNRLKKCVDLINKLLWYCIPHNNKSVNLIMIKQFINDQRNWKEALNRSEPWIIGYTLIEKLDFKSLREIAKYIIDNFANYNQFISLVMSADTLLPLQANIEARRQYINLKESIEKEIIALTSDNISKLFKGVLDNLLSHGSVHLSEGIKSLISYLLIEKEDDNAELLTILEECCVWYPFEKYIKSGHSIYRSLIYIGIISVIPLKRLASIERLYIEIIEKINQLPEGLEFLELLAIGCVFWNKSIGTEEAIQAKSSIFTDILTKTFKSFDHHSATLSPLNKNFSIYSLFAYINAIVPHTGRQILQPHESILENLFWRSIEQGSELHGLSQSMRMRYATRSILTCKEQNLKRLIVDIPKIARDEYIFYKELLSQIEEDGEEELPHYENIINLFIEISEFLIRITGYLNENRQPSEDIILELIQCPFPALKKSAFILLKAMYQLKIVPREPPKTYIDLLKFEIKLSDELTASMCSSISTYLYTWQALLLRRAATERVSSNEQQMNISLEEYIQNQGYSDLLIKNCFVVLDDKLQYLTNEADYNINCEQLIETDYEINFMEEIDINQKIFKMSMQTLFLYIIHFPIFLRNFMDKTKKYKNICERLLRNVISDAIFKEEVAKIELHEQQWKAAGNFEIFVTAKNKEIYAEYTHDVIRIGLRLVMRGNYPLSPISIEFGQGLKMQEGSRWGLMLQSQLHNRNNTIINGILLWKENIDKKLSGVEQCAICFDIVNTQGQLPKKGCKTCRKKFHGNCIMKWFTKSNKSECPLCKSQFL